MYDYWRLLIVDRKQINTILNNPLFTFTQVFERNTSELYDFPQSAKWHNWEIDVFSPTHLLIKGSIHKYYNNGTNETDFFFHDAIRAIKQFCSAFQLNPGLARVENLEFGVNVRPTQSASEIIEQVICYKNTRPIRPYESRRGYYFIEFDVGDYYLKIYDKGKQYKGPNILRFEIKAAKNRFLMKHANISTLEDLTSIVAMRALGVKINQLFNDVVFNDPSIDIQTLTTADRKNYLLMKDPNEWAKNKKRKTSTHRNRENRFKAIVEEYGTENIRSGLRELIKQKTFELTTENNLPVFTAKYRVKSDNYSWRDLRSLQAEIERMRLIPLRNFLPQFCRGVRRGKYGRGPPGGSRVLPRNLFCGYPEAPKNDSDRINFSCQLALLLCNPTSVK
jgi:hypothetical protein